MVDEVVAIRISGGGSDAVVNVEVVIGATSVEVTLMAGVLLKNISGGGSQTAEVDDDDGLHSSMNEGEGGTMLSDETMLFSSRS